MRRSISVALVGDYDPTVTAHIVIPEALDIAGSVLDLDVKSEWLATPALSNGAFERLSAFDALWCVPASPYESEEGAIESIRFARTTGLPFLGTCGGYQHAVLEYARSVLDLQDAENAEVNPNAGMPLIAQMSCALVETTGSIIFDESSYIRKLYGTAEVQEGYHCSYGVDPKYLPLFENSDLRFSGFDSEGEPRSFELINHPFFVGTAFQPERSALTGKAHPLICAFAEAAAKRLPLRT